MSSMRTAYLFGVDFVFIIFLLQKAWEHIRPIFQSIAAKVEDGSPCCDWVGPEGAGHFVKMVHNGIEYGMLWVV